MWWKSEKREVTAFLYRILVAEAPAKGYARTVAERMQVPYPTLSKYWLGRRFPASLVRPLFLATGCSERVADFFLLMTLSVWHHTRQFGLTAQAAAYDRRVEKMSQELGRG